MLNPNQKIKKTFTCECVCVSLFFFTGEQLFDPPAGPFLVHFVKIFRRAHGHWKGLVAALTH